MQRRPAEFSATARLQPVARRMCTISMTKGSGLSPRTVNDMRQCAPTFDGLGVSEHRAFTFRDAWLIESLKPAMRRDQDWIG
jgi:hypothetical protein